MKCVTPQTGPENEGSVTPSNGAPTDAERVLELAAVLDPAAFDDDVPKSKMQVAQLQWAARRHLAMEEAGRAVAAGWVHHDEVKVAEARAELHHSNLIRHWDRADAAEAKVARVEALRDAEIASEIESRVRAARGDVRCLDCNLRYDERQEYGCHTSGRGHSYDEDDLASAEQIERSGSVEHVTLSVADLRAALADPAAGGRG